LINPLEGLCHGRVEVVNGGHELVPQLFFGAEVPAFDHFPGQDANPDLNLVHPRGTLERIVKDNGPVRPRKEGLTGIHRAEDTALTFFTQVDLQITKSGGGANKRFGLMGVDLRATARPYKSTGYKA
jgi:hypothetical protein